MATVSTTTDLSTTTHNRFTPLYTEVNHDIVANGGDDSEKTGERCEHRMVPSLAELLLGRIHSLMALPPRRLVSAARNMPQHCMVHTLVRLLLGRYHSLMAVVRLLRLLRNRERSLMGAKTANMEHKTNVLKVRMAILRVQLDLLWGKLRHCERLTRETQRQGTRETQSQGTMGLPLMGLLCSAGRILEGLQLPYRRRRRKLSNTTSRTTSSI